MSFASPFAEQLYQVREVISSLTPTEQPSLPFVVTAGDIEVKDEPAISHRHFNVTASNAPGLTDTYMASRTRQTKRSFDVEMIYDAQHNLSLLDACVAADDDLIIANLESPVNYVANIRIINCTGGSIVKQGDFWRRTLTFETLYDHNF